MKRIANYRKLLGLPKTAELKEVKSAYRSLMKEWHPDKFAGNEEEKLQAEEKSKRIIEAYHFLVSIDPETVAQDKEEYLVTVRTSNIVDFDYKDTALLIKFANGCSYEYLGILKSMYEKFVNADAKARFAKRHIYDTFTYRKMSNSTEE